MQGSQGSSGQDLSFTVIRKSMTRRRHSAILDFPVANTVFRSGGTHPRTSTALWMLPSVRHEKSATQDSRSTTLRSSASGRHKTPNRQRRSWRSFSNTWVANPSFPQRQFLEFGQCMALFKGPLGICGTFTGRLTPAAVPPKFIYRFILFCSPKTTSKERLVFRSSS